MKVINIHKRTIAQPFDTISKLLKTLATPNDLMLANDKWPPMRMDNGLEIGSKGGHGPIKYFIIEYLPNNSITFQFNMQGFDGIHRFEIIPLDEKSTEISHTINMNTSGIATVKWTTAIRWLHDAFIEDAFDRVENHFAVSKKQSRWSLWVKILRRIMKPKRQPQHLK